MTTPNYDDVSGAVEAGLGFEFWNSGVPVTRNEQAKEAEQPTAVVLPERAFDRAEEPVAANYSDGRFSSDHDVIAYRLVGDYDETSSSYYLPSSGELGSFRYH